MDLMLLIILVISLTFFIFYEYMEGNYIICLIFFAITVKYIADFKKDKDSLNESQRKIDNALKNGKRISGIIYGYDDFNVTIDEEGHQMALFNLIVKCSDDEFITASPLGHFKSDFPRGAVVQLAVTEDTVVVVPDSVKQTV